MPGSGIDLPKTESASRKIFEGLVELVGAVDDFKFREGILLHVGTYWRNAVINSDWINKGKSEEMRHVIAVQAKEAYNQIYKIIYGRENPFG